MYPVTPILSVAAVQLMSTWLASAASFCTLAGIPGAVVSAGADERLLEDLLVELITVLFEMELRDELRLEVLRLDVLLIAELVRLLAEVAD